MKKIIFLLAFTLLSVGVFFNGFAQTKKNGAKDMRFKANKVHLKKDGTADKRFKAKH